MTMSWELIGSVCSGARFKKQQHVNGFSVGLSYKMFSNQTESSTNHHTVSLFYDSILNRDPVLLPASLTMVKGFVRLYKTRKNVLFSLYI